MKSALLWELETFLVADGQTWVSLCMTMEIHTRLGFLVSSRVTIISFFQNKVLRFSSKTNLI